MIYALTMQTRELFSCVAASAFISNIPDAPNFYYNTAIISSICEIRAYMEKHDIHPLKQLLNTTKKYDFFLF